MKIIDAFFFILCAVFLSVTVIALMTGCGSAEGNPPIEIVQGPPPSCLPDAGPQVEPDSGSCFRQTGGEQVACDEACWIAQRSHEKLPCDSGIFDITQCLTDCECVQPCESMLWVDTQFLPCDIACSDAGDRDTCMHSCSCVAN